MAFDILQFKEQGLVYGGARPCLFQVTIGQALDPADQFNPNALADFPFLCSSRESSFHGGFAYPSAIFWSSYQGSRKP